MSEGLSKILQIVSVSQQEKCQEAHVTAGMSNQQNTTSASARRLRNCVIQYSSVKNQNVDTVFRGTFQEYFGIMQTTTLKSQFVEIFETESV